MLKIGQELKGKYRITGMIGKGGMSTVYMANDMELARKVWAIKEVKRNAKDSAGRPIEQSLERETGLLAKLDHPSIVDIVDTLKTDDYIYIVMDYVDGRPLDKVVREEGPQSEEDVQSWMLQICDALSYLHSQNPPIIYRDMKPNNIMLRDDGYIKLIDLGVAREYKGTVSKDTTQFGTEGYAPPEQYGRAETDARSDIYAIGATMWHLLTGEAPCEMPLPDARTKNPNIGEGFAEVIIPKATQLNREERYQSCEELAADLNVYQELTHEYREKQKSKVRMFAGALAAAIVLFIVGGVCTGLNSYTIGQEYSSLVSMAEHAANTSDAMNYYEQAISTKPDETEPYIGMIESITATGTMSKDDYNKISSLIETNRSSLEGSRNWSDLNYQMGKAIWYNYQSGDSSTSSLINVEAAQKALPYFKVAADDATYEEKTRASMYYSIADFVASINSKITTGDDDSSLYQNYFNNLQNLMESCKSETNPVVKLNAYSLVENALENYSKNFKNAGVPESDVKALYDAANSGLVGLEGEFTDSAREEQRVQALGRLNTQGLTKFTTAYHDSSVSGK